MIETLLCSIGLLCIVYAACACAMLVHDEEMKKLKTELMIAQKNDYRDSRGRFVRVDV